MKLLNIKLKNNVEFQSLNDEELVNYIVETKNVLIFDILYKRYEKVVYNKILGFGILENKSEDLTTSFFLDLYKNLKYFDANSKFSNWMFYRMYIHCTKYINNDAESQEKIRSTKIDETHLRIEVNDAILYQMNPLKLKKIMRFIEPEEKTILLLHYQDDISMNELQLLYNTNEVKLKEKLRKAKVRIIEIYNDL